MTATSPADNASPPDEQADPRKPEFIQEPPAHPVTIMRQIGPGLIIAASIVGSGELIMTTKTGAEAGIVLLWLILLGCVVKVFVQLELGRFTISHGETTLSALNRVPGPRTRRVNWVVIFWGIMMVTTVGQLGGIVGGVGQALALTFPLTGDFQTQVSIPSENNIRAFADWQLVNDGKEPIYDPELPERLQEMQEADRARQTRRMQWIEEDINRLGTRGLRLMECAQNNQPLVDEAGASLTEIQPIDNKIWAALVAVVTAVLLYIGRYRLIERFSIALVVSFSLVTIGNVIALQLTDDYSLSTETILSGLSFGFPEGSGALVTALATFGIIGVGATELISYPYWCLEKGYARSAGPRDDSDAWLARAKGWYRVMKYDVFSSMVIYTLATAAFYFMGVAVLHSEGRNPERNRMVYTLAQSYVPIFDDYAKWIFLGGAIAVLYSTYLVASAGNARMVADFFGVVGLSNRDADSAARAKLVLVISVIFPLACGVAYIAIPSPVLLVTVCGVAQAIMLPMIGFSSIYFRYCETDNRLRPSLSWDMMLILSSLALLLVGGYLAYDQLAKLAGTLGLM